MPQVPVYGEPQVRTEALRPVMQRTPDVSSGARALAQGLNDIGEAADRIDLRNAQAKAAEVESSITSDWLKWDAENRNKFRGANADGYAPAAEAWWKAAAENAGKDLSPRAKNLAGQSLRSKQVAAMGNVLTFTGAEKERHADETYSADVNTTIQFAVTSGDVAGGAQQVRDKAAVLGARKNWTTEQVQAEANKNLSALHLAHVTKLASTNAEAAQAYYNAAKDRNEIAFAAQGRIEEVLKGEGDNQFSRAKAAELMTLTPEQRKAEFAKITDPDRLEKTQIAFKNMLAIEKEAENQIKDAAEEQAWKLFNSGRPVPADLLDKMDQSVAVPRLKEAQRSRADRLLNGRTVKTNPENLAKVYDMMRDDPEKFKTLKMATLTESFSTTDIEQIARIQRDMLKPDGAKDVATTTQLMGTYTGGWKPEKRAVFERAAYDELNTEEKAKGRALTYDEKKKALDRLILSGEVVSGSIFTPDPNKQLYETTPEERARFVPTMTSNDKKLVRNALIAEGNQNPTEAQIMERFKLAKGIR